MIGAVIVDEGAVSLLSVSEFLEVCVVVAKWVELTVSAHVEHGVALGVDDDAAVTL